MTSRTAGIVFGLATLALTGPALAVVTPVPRCSPTLRHFQCYEVKPGQFSTPAPTVVDRFGTVVPTLRYPHRLCAPADKRGEDPTAPADPQHLVGYVAKAKTPKRLGLTVTNQFGTITLDAIRPDLLMVPTAKSLGGPPAPLVPPLVDHFMCYKVKRSRGTPKFVPQVAIPVVDQLETVTLDASKPARLCVPANKNGEDPSAPGHPLALLCYKSRSRTPFATPVVQTANQFGPDEMTLIHRRELCVPSLIAPDTCGTTTTTTTSSSTSTTTTTTTTSTTSTTESTTTTTTTTTSTTTTTLAPVKIAGVRYRSFGNTGGNEVYLGQGDLGVSANRVEQGLTWVKPGTYDVTFTYDPMALTLTTTITGDLTPPTLIYNLTGPLAAMDSFEINVADRDTNSQVDFLNVTLDGNPVGSFVGNDAFASYTFPSSTLDDGFTFTGTLVISGPFSGSQELSRVDIQVGQNFAP